MKKKTIYIFILLLTFICCRKDDDQMKSDFVISEKIEQKFSSQEGIVSFENLTSFEWDKLMILGPYVNIENVQTMWGLNLSKIDKHIIKSEDGIHSIAFFKDNELIKITDISRSIGDFINLEVLIPKSRAKFLTQEGKIMIVSDDLNIYSYYRDITYFPRFRGFEKKRGLLLNHKQNPNTNKSLQYIQKDSIHFLILEKTIKVTEQRVASELLDTVQLINSDNNLKVVFGECDNLNNRLIFAFSVQNDLEYYEVQLKTWEIDIKNNKFIEISEQDLNCKNDEFRNNP